MIEILPAGGMAKPIEKTQIVVTAIATFSFFLEQNANGITIPKNLSVAMAVIVITDDTNVTATIYGVKFGNGLINWPTVTFLESLLKFALA